MQKRAWQSPKNLPEDKEPSPQPRTPSPEKVLAIPATQLRTTEFQRAAFEARQGTCIPVPVSHRQEDGELRMEEGKGSSHRFRMKTVHR